VELRLSVSLAEDALSSSAPILESRVRASFWDDAATVRSPVSLFSNETTDPFLTVIAQFGEVRSPCDDAAAFTQPGSALMTNKTRMTDKPLIIKYDFSVLSYSTLLHK
jgi:hypothetical protein